MNSPARGPWRSVIVGSGPATAVLLASLRPEDAAQVLVISPEIGGGMAKLGTYLLQSYVDELDVGARDCSLGDFVPGTRPSPTGDEYARYIREVILRTGASLSSGIVNDVWQDGTHLSVGLTRSDGGRESATATNVVLATGVRAKCPTPAWRQVALTADETYERIRTGRTSWYKDKSVILVGCGNTAMQFAATMAAQAKEVIILGTRYVGVFPFETSDRFAWRASSQLACELVAKSVRSCAEHPGRRACVRYLVYDDLGIDEHGINLTYSDERNRHPLAKYSMPWAHPHSRQAEARPGQWREVVPSDAAVVVWATGVAPVYPTGPALSRLARDQRDYILHDGGRTSMPGLWVAGACAGFRAVNEMCSSRARPEHHKFPAEERGPWRPALPERKSSDTRYAE